MANDSVSSRRVEMLKQLVEKLLQESRNHVQWDGEKFVPKPMQLSRINLGKFRDPQSFQDRNIRVRYTTAELTASIKITDHAELTVVNEWNNLKEELKATTELLKTTVDNLVKTNTELRNAKSDLTKELEGTKKELEKTKANVNNLSIKLNETKQELVRTRADFLMTTDDLSAKLNEVAETKITTGSFSVELKTISDRLGKELKVAEENLKKDLRVTLTDLETMKTNLTSTMTELNSTKSAVADLATKLNDRTSEIVDTRTSEIVDIGQMPTSCEDLQRMGQKVNGFFSVKGSKRMEMVYCNFIANQNEKQKWIGYADVKSTPVHFYVQKISFGGWFSTENTPVPFELAVVNEGNAMNLTSGIFTAPRPGNYFFSFVGLALLNTINTNAANAVFHSYLYLNGIEIGRNLVVENRGPVYQFSPLTLQSTLNLRKGDQVWVQISYFPSSIHYTGPDIRSHHQDRSTHFTGFMLEEEIVASL